MVLEENLLVIVASIQEGATDVGVGVVGGPARGADVVHGGLRVGPLDRYVNVFPKVQLFSINGNEIVGILSIKQ